MNKPLLIVMTPAGEVLATVPAPAGTVVKRTITKVVEKLDDLWTGFEVVSVTVRPVKTRPGPRTVRFNGVDWDARWLN